MPGADHAFKKIPEGVSVEQAVLLTDILPTAYYGALQAEIRPGQTVAVIGLGPVGLLAVECARLFGPARVLAIDRIPERLKQAEALGAEPVHADRALEVAARGERRHGPRRRDRGGRRRRVDPARDRDRAASPARSR